MNKSFVLAAVILGLVATGFTYYLLSRAAGTPEQRLVKVVKTKRELHLGALIRAEDLELQRVKLAAVPKGSLVSMADAVGKAATKDIPAGTVLTKDHVAPAPMSASATVTEGMRAFTITTETEVGAASLVRPGDRIDILYLGPNTDVAQVVAQDVRVLELPDARSRPGKTLTSTPVNGERVHLVVEVSPDQAAVLFAAHTTGILSVTLRNRSDTATVAIHPSVTLRPPRTGSTATAGSAPPGEPTNSGSSARPASAASAATFSLPPPPATGGPDQPATRVTPLKHVTVIRGGKRETIEVEE